MDASIERTFVGVGKNDVDTINTWSLFAEMGMSSPTQNWDDLLKHNRILIISEAGAGKTYECRKKANQLLNLGRPSFFIDLSALALTQDLHHLFHQEEKIRFNEWIDSETETATFFLDSLDELNLNPHLFKVAINVFNETIKYHLDRTQIILTTRPTPFDRQYVQEQLRVPQKAQKTLITEDLTHTTIPDLPLHPEHENNLPKSDWDIVLLTPLNEQQIIDFCRYQNISNPEKLLSELIRHNALEFARRPQDLLEICSDWRTTGKIRKHADQIETNIRTKLEPTENRKERAEISLDKALDGARRLAFAAQMTRRLTFQYGANSDSDEKLSAINSSIVLSDWSINEQKALLERSLFGYATYGQVRFHHRSVTEYLAAKHLLALRQKGMSPNLLKKLIFDEVDNKLFVLPSKRPIAAWLALEERNIYELLRDNDPLVLMNEGDPESLSDRQKIEILQSYCLQYSSGGWRGSEIIPNQVNRFTSQALGSEILKIWQDGIENPDVRETLLRLIEASPIKSCSELVYSVATDPQARMLERLIAIKALIALDDKRLNEISHKISNADSIWPEKIARSAILHLFPGHMSIQQLGQSLRWLKNEEPSDFISWQLSSKINSSNLNNHQLKTLQAELYKLISEGLLWEHDRTKLTSSRSYLRESLAATCNLTADTGIDQQWLDAVALSLCIDEHHSHHTETQKLLLKAKNLSTSDSEKLFWSIDSLIYLHLRTSTPQERFFNIVHYDNFWLDHTRDFRWILNSLNNKNLDIDKRRLMLESAFFIAGTSPDKDALIEKIKDSVSDNETLYTRVIEYTSPSQGTLNFIKQNLNQQRKEHQEYKRQQERWLNFKNYVLNDPDQAFAPMNRTNTAIKILQHLTDFYAIGYSPKWDRALIEDNFDTKTAVRLRETLLSLWRNNTPSLASERSETKRNSFPTIWLFCLIGIYAEAEDDNWSVNLSDTEAATAARYVPIDMSGFPKWFTALQITHPVAVDQTLGKELSWELNLPAHESTFPQVLSFLCSAPRQTASSFIPRMMAWIQSPIDKYDHEKLKKVLNLILNCGSKADHSCLSEKALSELNRPIPKPIVHLWLSTLFSISPEKAISHLNQQLSHISSQSDLDSIFADLFECNPFNLSLKNLSPNILLTLTRLAFQHIQTKDDLIRHSGVYSLTTRDNAQQARENLFSALLDSSGQEAYRAKLTLAREPFFSHIKDRIIFLAKEKLAQDLDSQIYTEDECVNINNKFEAPINSNHQMFSILKDRLAALDSLLLTDMSPRETWQSITIERLMRREIARELRNNSNSLYSVIQESVTADEKETDIRLHSPSGYEAVIELKIGENYSSNALLDTIELQLTKKYLVESCRKSGAVLITLSKDRKWKHPYHSAQEITIDELMPLLHAEAKRVQDFYDCEISVHLLDLRPRLLPETDAKRKKRSPLLQRSD